MRKRFDNGFTLLGSSSAICGLSDFQLCHVYSFIAVPHFTASDQHAVLVRCEVGWLINRQRWTSVGVFALGGVGSQLSPTHRLDTAANTRACWTVAHERTPTASNDEQRGSGGGYQRQLTSHSTPVDLRQLGEPRGDLFTPATFGQFTSGVVHTAVIL